MKPWLSTDMTASRQPRTRAPPISALSTLWVTLCASLVVRRVDLIAVFVAFLVSFGLAFIVSLFALRSDEGDLRPPLRTKSYVGIIVCAAASSLLLLCDDFLGGGNGSDRFSGLISHRSCRHVVGQSEFEAVALLTGYLAFDLWYTHIFCRPLPALLSIGEDALTLTTFLTLLTKFDVSYLSRHRPLFLLWLVYKAARLVAQLGSVPRPVHATYNKKVIDTLNNKITLCGDYCIDSSIEKKYAADESCASGDPERITKDTSKRSAIYDELEKKDLWIIHGASYDLSDFVDRHPGGKDAIELGRGRDCTALFESYHAFTENHRRLLKKYRPIHWETDAIDKKTSGLSLNRKIPSDPFYETLKNRAAKVLRENGVDPTKQRCATPSRAAYYFAVFTCLVIAGKLHIKGYLLGSFAFAIFGWLIGSLGHDGGHYAVSRTPWVNNVALWGISLLCNPIMWQHQHTYAHHSHTNDFDCDPDLHHFEVFLRVHRRMKRNKGHYKYQANPAYVLFAFAFVVFGTCVKIPYGFITGGSLYGMVEWTDRRPLRALAAVSHLSLYLFIVVLGPFMFSSRSPMIASGCVIINVATSGLLFAFFSQVNHLNELSLAPHGAHESLPQDSTKTGLLQTSWAAAQVQTSNNFATNSFFWHVASNGLNMQIEHHLFPGLNHSHLHIVAPIVKRTCEEFGVPYKSYESWRDIMQATLSWLETMSVE